MKKYIYVLNALELMSKLYVGKRVEGVLFVDENTGRLTFKAWNRKAPKWRRKDEVVRQLESGWVKESPEKYKLFISVYKKLGLARILNIIDREAKEAQDALFDKELIESI
jgi:hypothetical protein